ncbi:MAG: prepilin-type N-terminal cleavage/methylation domain-containing protein, partial [Bacteroidetes bacterium]|nr:prepilin-type N-terminal cleavage/methylation domain-containing protein [Bacteroidota bacterium]
MKNKNTKGFTLIELL